MTSDRSPLQKYGPVVAGVCSLLAGIALLFWVTAPVAGWFATALVLLGLWGLSKGAPSLTSRLDAVPEKWRSRAWSTAPYAVVAVVVAWTTWPAVIGEVPMSQDHAHHYLQTAIFTDDLLARGHLFGWTERIGTGLPFGDVYATGVYAVTGFLRIISFGLISRATSYAVGIYLVWLIPAWAIVAWTRRLLVDVVETRWITLLACVVAAGLFAVDVGTDREGGWVYSMFHAVWPQVVGTGMWLWAVLAMVRLLEKPTTRRLGVAAIVAGFAFWAHPINAMNLLITAPILFVVALSTYRRGDENDEDTTIHGAAWWLIPAFALAAVIGFGWMSHFIGASDSMSSFTAYGDSMREYAERLLSSGAPFAGSTALAAIAALVGLLVALARGGVARHFTAVALVVFVALASTDVMASSDFGLSESAPFIMFKRFIITAKPLLFSLAGVGVGVVVSFALSERQRLGNIATALALLTVSPLVYAGFDAAPEVLRMPSSRFLTAEDLQVTESLGQIVSVVDRELDSTPGPKRVVVWHGRGESGDYALFAVAELGVGYLPNRNPPAHAYADLGIVRDLEQASLLGASHIIARTGQKFPGARQLGEYPPYYLWRLNNTPGDGVRLFRSSGIANTVEWEPMRHVAEVTNYKGKGELVFAIPPHPKWTYTQNGKELETKTYEFSKTAPLTQVLGFENGEIVAEYNDTTTERVAFILMLVVLLLALVGIAFGWPLPQIPERWRDRAPVPVVVACALLMVVAALVLRSAGEAALDAAWAKDKGERVLEALHRQEPTVVDYRPDPFCVRPKSRNPRVGCDLSQLEPRLKLSRPRNQRTPACMEITVPDNGYIDLRWELPTGTTRIEGRFDGRMNGVKPLAKKGESLEELNASSMSFDTDGQVFEMRLQNRNPRTQEVCFELVAVAD